VSERENACTRGRQQGSDDGRVQTETERYSEREEARQREKAGEIQRKGERKEARAEYRRGRGTERK